MKITFMGAGSTVFAKNVLGDVFLTEALTDGLSIALYDIDATRLEESFIIIENLNQKYAGAPEPQKGFYINSQYNPSDLGHEVFKR